MAGILHACVAVSDSQMANGWSGPLREVGDKTASVVPRNSTEDGLPSVQELRE